MNSRKGRGACVFPFPFAPPELSIMLVLIGVENTFISQKPNKQEVWCARFLEFVQNFSERQILWSLCSVVFHAFALKLIVLGEHFN